MTEENFNLSEKIFWRNGTQYIKPKDVKEFIRRLKEELTINKSNKIYTLTGKNITDANHRAIDKLAGDLK